MSVEPLYGLRVTTRRLELRLRSHEELVELAHLAERGIHPRDEMAFGVAWTDAVGEPVAEWRFRLEKEDWPGENARIEGLAPCLPLFGAD